MFSISIEPSPLLQSMINRVALIPNGLEKAGRRAVQRTLRGGKQDAARKVAQRYTIKTGKVTSTIRTRQSGLSGVMSSKGARNMLKEFILRPRTRPRKMPAGGVYVQNVRGQGGNLLHAFLQKGGGVFEREGRSRYPIRHLTGPSAPQMLGNPIVGPHIESKMFQRLQVNLDHELNAVLGGF